MYPLLISSVGLLVCLLTTLFATDFFKIKSIEEIEPTLKKQLIISIALMTIGITIVTWFSIPPSFTIFNFGTQKVIKNCFTFALIYGVALAALDMFSTIATGLAINAYGPINDNASSIAEIARTSHKIYEITDDIDSVGNITAAIRKGFSIDFAALVSLALFGAFSVASAALKMVEKVCKQFDTIKGLMEGSAKPDNSTCIKISTNASFIEMIALGILVMMTPLVVGILFGIDTLSSVLVGSLISGVRVIPTKW
ncbi:hypothetical protein Nepgr_022421 [Nepenthes gracilis]|uniref:H(+)-exporting diphosphatase n=1 Tax=Nepenthes gracilis TaxID=150966 RepID=A0AAD3XY61_NEPGR|nr:hypothetical protein Nepgr_022421 [Nepenthes gracilis]